MPPNPTRPYRARGSNQFITLTRQAQTLMAARMRSLKSDGEDITTETIEAHAESVREHLLQLAKPAYGAEAPLRWINHGIDLACAAEHATSTP